MCVGDDVGVVVGPGVVGVFGFEGFVFVVGVAGRW